MKKIVLFILIVALFINPKIICAADSPKLVAASYSDRYHLPSCKVAQKIAPEDLKTFNTPEEAAAAGFVPCKKCNPPAPKDFKKERTNFSSKKNVDPNS